jgi:hypothetical protein
MPSDQAPVHVPDSRRSAASRAAMRRRWGPQRVLRLDELDPVTREIVLAVLAARENARQKLTPEQEAEVAASRKVEARRLRLAAELRALDASAAQPASESR